MQELTKKTSFYWSRRKKFKTAPAPAPKGLKSLALAPLHNTANYPLYYSLHCRCRPYFSLS